MAVLLSGCSAYQTRTYNTEHLKRLHPQEVAIKQGQLEYYQIGRGSPIILIPGYVTDVTSWDRDFLVALAQQHRVIILNNRNVGGSFVQSTHYQAKDLANDIYQLILQLHLKKPAVVGISMGGMIAQELAILHQDKLGQLILINTAIAGDKAVRPSTSVTQKMVNMPTSKIGRYNLAVELFFTPTSKSQMKYALITNRFKPLYYTEVEPQKVMVPQRRLIFAWADDNKAAMQLKKLSLPVLILNGESDRVIPPVNSVILANTIPHARLERWKGGGHAMIFQYPQALADAINAFIVFPSP